MKIRIAVAVAADGSWCCTPDPRSAAYVARNYANSRGGGHVVWVEADVPLPPELVTVQGRVEE